MSRSYCSYDEDWQRRKSLLIRSLFHDIPILSPVEEESNGSSTYYNVPRQEVFASPLRPYSPLPPLIIEKIPIINKHDEPEEYYNKLHKKIKRIYVKLFIEKRNFSSIEYDSNYSDTSVNDEEVMDNENLDLNFLESNSPDNGNYDSIIEDEEARKSSVSNQSNGFEADYESMETAIIDVVNYTRSNDDVTMILEEEESDSENIHEGEVIYSVEPNNASAIDDQHMTESEEPNDEEIEQCDDGEGHREETNIDEPKIIEETNQTGQSDTVSIHDPEFSGQEDSHHSTTGHNATTESKESGETEPEHESIQSNPDSYEKELKSKELEGGNELTASNAEAMERDVESSNSSEGLDYRQITTAALVHFDGSQHAGDRESRVYEDSVKSVILPTRYRIVVIHRNVDADDRIEVLKVLEENADPETVSTLDYDDNETIEEEDQDFEEVSTPQADARKDMRTDVTEENVEPPPQDATGTEEKVAPTLDNSKEEFEVMRIDQLVASDEDIEGIRALRQDATEAQTSEIIDQLVAYDEDTEEMRTLEQDATEADTLDENPGDTDEEMRNSPVETTQEELELMRTPRPYLSHETIPRTHGSNSESTGDHTAMPQEVTGLTSSSQDGGENNISEIQTSNDINEVLTSIFNESRSKDCTPILGRKRKLVDKSVQVEQTSRVSWDDIRTNFFIGTPKIFRLCACTDHICN